MNSCHPTHPACRRPGAAATEYRKLGGSEPQRFILGQVWRCRQGWLLEALRGSGPCPSPSSW